MPDRAASLTSLGREGAANSAVRSRPGLRTVTVRFGLVALVVALDLASKSAVFAWLDRLERAGKLVPDTQGHLRQPILGGWLAFLPSLNPAAAFGHFESFPYLLVAGRIAAGVFLVWLLLRARGGRPVFTAALVLVLGGALGNLYDNVLRARDLPLDFRYMDRPFGPVRDFIDVYVGAWSWHFETFNVADACITAGAILLVATSILRSPKEEPVAHT